MIIHSWHSPDFNILDSIDHSKTSWSDECFTDAYKWLFNLLGTDRIIWGWGDEQSHCPVHGREQKHWILDVPEDNLIYLNTYCWDCVIGKWNWYPPQLNHIDNEKVVDKFIDKWEKERNKEQDWLENIFTDVNDENAQILIKCPIKPEWIVDCRHISEYELDFWEYEILSCVFDTEDTMNKQELIWKSYLNSRGIVYDTKKEFKNNQYFIKVTWEN